MFLEEDIGKLDQEEITSRPESNFWQYWKKNTPNISWTRIENTTTLGTPDLLGYNKNNIFFTVELKVACGLELEA
jgi:hypothetical protein